MLVTQSLFALFFFCIKNANFLRVIVAFTGSCPYDMCTRTLKFYILVDFATAYIPGFTYFYILKTLEVEI